MGLNKDLNFPLLIYALVKSNTYASSKEILLRALKNRFVGFRGEIEFSSLLINHKSMTFEGGYILPLRNKKATLNSPIYFTVDSKSPNHYNDLYRKLNCGNFAKIIYVRYHSNNNSNEWQMTKFDGIAIPLPTPKFTIYDFQDGFIELGNDINLLLSLFTRKSSKVKPDIHLSDNEEEEIYNILGNYSFNQLINLYVSRLIFDGYIGLKYFKGLPSDIDLIRKKNNGEFVFYEVKEKDLSKSYPIGFGIDIQRLNDCLLISKNLNVSYKYIVRKVNNQYERKFLEWRYLDLNEFNNLVDKSIIKEGGYGMNTIEKSGNQNPTFVVEESHFKKFTQ